MNIIRQTLEESISANGSQKTEKFYKTFHNSLVYPLRCFTQFGNQIFAFPSTMSMGLG